MTDAPVTRRVRNPFAVASIVFAVVMTAVMAATRVLSLGAPALALSWHLPITSIVVALSTIGLAGVVLAAVAAILGAVGATRPGRPHALAAAGLAIGCTAAGSYLVNLLSSHLVVAAFSPR